MTGQSLGPTENSAERAVVERLKKLPYWPLALTSQAQNATNKVANMTITKLNNHNIVLAKYATDCDSKSGVDGAVTQV